MSNAIRRADRATRFLNRELSWIEFNRRVLEEAGDESNPLLERLKFLAITASNLDEFFMVRVGGLQGLREQGNTRRDPSGLTPAQQLREIGRRLHRFTIDQYAELNRQLWPALVRAGIARVPLARLASEQVAWLRGLFEAEVLPVLTPRAIAADEEFPLLAGLTLHLAVRLRGPDGAERFAVVPLPRTLPRLFTLPAADGHQIVLLEDLAELGCDLLFPGMEIIETAVFRLTRNADMSVAEDLAADLLERMEDILVARRQSACVRLEIAEDASLVILKRLSVALDVDADHTYRIPGPLDLSGFMMLAATAGFDELKNETWPPQPSPLVPAGETMFDVLSRRDVLIYCPFEAYDPVVRFIEEAAADPDVLAIKQILYRTSRNSPVIAALARAAALGKQVTAVVELKARFDEARNIDWARALEPAGVQVIYGIRGLKTHAKVCLVVRREPSGIRRYLHFGTGNYNEITSRLYADISYLTAAEDYGLDAAQFFNTITGYSQPARYRKLEAAPLGLKPRLLDLIRGETQRARAGQPARILAKVNSLADPQVIEALYEASQAGVKTDLLVRGICCLRPGLPGWSDNIRVFSVVDRYLEHARILYFHHGGEPRVFISSADWMTRNLEKRIELLVEVGDPASVNRLIGILKTSLQDNVKARELQADGTYRRVEPLPGTKAVRSQLELYRQAARAAAAARDSRKAQFTPHRPRRK